MDTRRLFLTIIRFAAIAAIAFLTLGSIGFLWAKQFVSTKWKNNYTEVEIDAFVEQINSSLPLPSNIYEAHKLVNPNQLNQEISDMENAAIFSMILGNYEQVHDEEACNCILAAERFENRMPEYHSFSWLFLGHALEQRTTEKKCFDFMQTSYLTTLSIRHFSKEINHLTFEEAVALICLSEHPTRYSQHPEQLSKRVAETFAD